MGLHGFSKFQIKVEVLLSNYVAKWRPKYLKCKNFCILQYLNKSVFFRLYDANTNCVISRYEIHRILFYARGFVEGPEAGCFAFTWSHGDSQESAIFQCHVFRCDIAEAVSRVSGRLISRTFIFICSF